MAFITIPDHPDLNGKGCRSLNHYMANHPGPFEVAVCYQQSSFKDKGVSKGNLVALINSLNVNNGNKDLSYHTPGTSVARGIHLSGVTKEHLKAFAASEHVSEMFLLENPT